MTVTRTSVLTSSNMKLLLTVLALLFTVSMRAQIGSVKVEFSSANLDSLVSINQRTNYNQNNLDGYRIGLYSGASKQEAMEVENQVLSMFPQVAVERKWDAPSWRVRIGNFRFRSEAITLLQSVKKVFPGAYIARDKDVKKSAFK